MEFGLFQKILAPHLRLAATLHWIQLLQLMGIVQVTSIHAPFMLHPVVIRQFFQKEGMNVKLIVCAKIYVIQ